MAVALSPSDYLGFQRPLTRNIRSPFIITNNNDKPIAFKVKTTDPKFYCVRPNRGRIEPGEHVEVTVILQAFKEEPPLDTKCKHKFLIQSTVITPEKENTSPQKTIASPEDDEAGKTYHQRLRVAYLPALTHAALGKDVDVDVRPITAIVVSRSPSPSLTCGNCEETARGALTRFNQV